KRAGAAAFKFPHEPRENIGASKLDEPPNGVRRAPALSRLWCPKAQPQEARNNLLRLLSANSKVGAPRAVAKIFRQVPRRGTDEPFQSCADSRWACCPHTEVRKGEPRCAADVQN